MRSEDACDRHHVPIQCQIEMPAFQVFALHDNKVARFNTKNMIELAVLMMVASLRLLSQAEIAGGRKVLSLLQRG